jgi:hypothetical protein
MGDMVRRVHVVEMLINVGIMDVANKRVADPAGGYGG